MPQLLQRAHAALSAAQQAELLALCSAAYEEDFLPHWRLLREAQHLLLLDAGRIVAHGAWLPRQLRVGAQHRALRCAYVEAVATLPHLQGRGLGTQLLRAIPPLLQGFEVAALSPSEPAFYARSGWELWQGRLFYLHEGQRHETPDEQVMIHRLPGPALTLDVRESLETDWREGDIW